MGRKDIYLRAEIEQWARDLIRQRRFRGLSQLVDTLIREEYERRQHAAPSAWGPGTPPPHHVASQVAAAERYDATATPVDIPAATRKRPHRKPRSTPPAKP